MHITIDPPADFDLFECVTAHGWRQLVPFSWDADRRVLTRVERFSGAGAVVLTIDEKLNIDMSADVDSVEVERRISHMLQLDISLADFHNFCPEHPHLSSIPQKKQGRLLRSPTLFEDLIKVIATTNTTWLQTKGMVSRVVEGYGELLPDGSGRAFPTAEGIASVGFDEFSATVRMGYRNSSVHKIATDIADGQLDLESLDDPSIPVQDLYRALLTLPGVGPYAASSLLLYMGRYNRVNSDSWARTLVGKELGIKATDKDVHAFFEPYGKWQALVYHFFPWRESAKD